MDFMRRVSLGLEREHARILRQMSGQAIRSASDKRRVGDHQLDATQAASRKLAQERGPEGLGPGWANVHVENLAPAIAVDAHRDNHATETMRPFCRTFAIGGVDPQVGPNCLRAAVAEKSAPCRRSPRTAARPGSWRSRSCPWLAPGRQPSEWRQPGRRPPAPPRRAPSRPSGAVRGSREIGVLGARTRLPEPVTVAIALN
jgi:hypothetical protein